jgi:hypothetical protein
MNRDGHNQVDFFTGTEVEHTPAFGLKTLFVVGVQDYHKIIEMVTESRTHQDTSKHIQHVYFGANHSFPNLSTNDGAGWALWESMIHNVLDAGILSTLDIDVNCVEGLLESGLTENRHFIPMISVKLPYVQQLGYNATIKLDDKDFDATTPGVWCHRLHNLLDTKAFTSWDAYTKDEIL